MSPGAPAGPYGDGDDEEDFDDEEEDEDAPPRKKRGGHGRRKIEIEYIDDKQRRHITFSKRKAGISKKAYELSRLTGAQVRFFSWLECNCANSGSANGHRSLGIRALAAQKCLFL